MKVDFEDKDGDNIVDRQSSYPKRAYLAVFIAHIQSMLNDSPSSSTEVVPYLLIAHSFTVLCVSILSLIYLNIHIQLLLLEVYKSSSHDFLQ